MAGNEAVYTVFSALGAFADGISVFGAGRRDHCLFVLMSRKSRRYSISVLTVHALVSLFGRGGAVALAERYDSVAVNTVFGIGIQNFLFAAVFAHSVLLACNAGGSNGYGLSKAVLDF